MRGQHWFAVLRQVRVQVDAQMANAALGSCARGGDADSAWELYRLMSERNITLGTISFRALLAALGKGGRWLRCLQVCSAGCLRMLSIRAAARSDRPSSGQDHNTPFSIGSPPMMLDRGCSNTMHC